MRPRPGLGVGGGMERMPIDFACVQPRAFARVENFSLQRAAERAIFAQKELQRQRGVVKHQP